MVGLLARRGADMSAGDKWGASPLHRACLEGHLAAARAVLDAGYARVKRLDGPMGWAELWFGRGQHGVARTHPNFSASVFFSSSFFLARIKPRLFCCPPLGSSFLFAICRVHLVVSLERAFRVHVAFRRFSKGKRASKPQRDSRLWSSQADRLIHSGRRVTFASFLVGAQPPPPPLEPHNTAYSQRSSFGTSDARAF